MVWDVVVRSLNGREWRLHGDRRSSVVVVSGGMTGMTATSAETSVTRVGRPGAQVVASRVESLAPSWEIVFLDRDRRGLGEVVSEWLSAWRVGVTVSVETPSGSWSVQGRVPPDFGVDFEVSPWGSGRRSLQVSWSWVADRPVWELSRVLPGGGEVLNFGDVVLAPSVEWSGAAQWVRVNGVFTVLPTTPVRARMILDHADNCVVTDMQGEKLVNASAWSRQRAMELSVVVPPGGAVEIGASSGVDVVWSVGVKSPWR